MIEDKRGVIDYDESGEGPAIVLVPGSCSTGAAWRPVIAQWDNRFRCVTTSLLGYGGTAERRCPGDADIAHEAETLETVIRRVARPVHLVGHSFGGLTALAVALRDGVPLLSLTIAEAPGPEILQAMGEYRHYLAFRRMTDDYFLAIRSGDTAAIASMIDFYGGSGTFASWPQRVRDYAIDKTPVNILDWESAYGFQLTPGMLAAITIPTLVFWGRDSHPAVACANRLISQCIPKAVATDIANAAHFMIATHAHDVAGLIAQHVMASEQELLKTSSFSHGI
jgi:pimeloyl-ACP methyl ester carboxylesterase